MGEERRIRQDGRRAIRVITHFEGDVGLDTDLGVSFVLTDKCFDASLDALGDLGDPECL